MQLNFLAALFLFLGSYFPLSIILAIQDVRSTSWDLPFCRTFSFWEECSLPALANPTLAICFIGVTSVSIIFFWFVLKNFDGRQEMLILESKTIPNDLINYVFPYLVSFMGLELGNEGKVWGFVVFLCWMFLITYRSGQILMNPLLLVAGWQLYEVNADMEGHKRNLRALSKTPVLPKQRLQSCLIQGIYVLSNRKNNG